VIFFLGILSGKKYKASRLQKIKDHWLQVALIHTSNFSDPLAAHMQ
jgi:hypothetical protein